MYADYLRKDSSLLNHKHMMPTEAHPAGSKGGATTVLSGILSFKNTPKQKAALQRKADARAKAPTNYLRNEVMREIQKDLRLA